MPIDKTKGSSSLGRKFRIGLAAAAIMIVANCTADSGGGTNDIYASAPLHKAVLDEQPVTVKRLLAAGADPNARISAPGWTLSYGYGAGHGTRVRANMNGMTPLHFAAIGEARHIPIAKRLLEAGADPNAKSYAGDTPMDIVKRSGSSALENLLRSYGGR